MSSSVEETPRGARTQDPPDAGGGRGSGARAPAPRRLRWLLPALLVIVWLALGSVGSGFVTKLGSVLQSGATVFLPRSAEATKVTELQAKFAESQAIAGIVLAARDTGITPADEAFLKDRAAALESLHSAVADRIGGLRGKVAPVVVSGDRQAAQLIVAVDHKVGGDTATLSKEIGDTVRQGAPPGLRIYVTGALGFAADYANVFSGLDSMLLMVTLAVVVVILVIIYRSPLLPLLVLLSGGFALSLSAFAVYFLAKSDVLKLDGLSQGIMMVLVLGAATDYALLLVARFREELQEREDRFEAMKVSLRASVKPLTASATTVMLGLLCLLLSDLNNNKSLGPVGAIGIFCALLASLTFLPAMLVLLGRVAFWPFRPKAGRPGAHAHPLWSRVARFVGARPRAVWVVTALILLCGAAFLPQFKSEGLQASDLFTVKPEGVQGMSVYGRHFPAGTGSPAVIFAKEGSENQVLAAAKAVPGVSDAEVAAAAGRPRVVDGLVEIDAILADDPQSDAALSTVDKLRTAVHAVPGADALVGGDSAGTLDNHTTARRDLKVIIPVVLVVILLVLALLLRSLLAPVLLTATVALSYAATMGFGAVIFNHVFHFPNADPTMPMLTFVFLVALGVDYNIFLMTRVREETPGLGARRGILRGLTVTGGVITSAGVVLAATFGALSVVPMVFLVQMAFLVAFGVLLDTLVVRSLLVPALSHDIGRKVWWPSRLAKGKP